MMQNLDRRIQFLRAHMVDDGYQERQGDYLPHGPELWASKQDVSDREKYLAATVARVAETRFVVRWSPFTAAIEATDRIACEGATYAISGIKEIGRREGLEITAARVDAGKG